MIFRRKAKAAPPAPTPPEPAPLEQDLLGGSLAEADPIAPDPPRKSRQHPLLVLLGCVLAVAVTAAAPALMFALGDIARFSRPSNADKPYTSRTVDGDDLYLVRMLHERQDTALAAYSGQQSSGQPLYLGASFTYDTMQADNSLASRCSTILSQLADNGVLPYNCIDDTLSAAGYMPDAFRGSSDSLGFTTIGYFPDWDGESQQMSMTLESRTGRLVSLQLLVGPDATRPDAATVLNAWVALNDLDILGDWTAPVGTQWEKTGLYSARGGLLATCVSCEDEQTGQCGISLDLVPCTENDLAAARQAGALYAGAADGEPAVRMQGNFNSGTGLYYMQPLDNGLYCLMFLEYSSNVSRCVCRREFCSHNTTDCPAVFASTGYLYADTNGNIYVFQPGSSGSGSATPAVVYRIPSSRTTVETAATLYDADRLDPIAVRDGVLYARQYAYIDTGSEIAPGAQPVVAVDLAGGGRTITPTRLAADETIAGVQGSCLVTVRRRGGRAPVSSLLTTPFLAAGIAAQGPLEVDLLDPATGERAMVVQLDWQELVSAGRLSGSDWLLCTNAVRSGISTDGGSGGMPSLYTLDMDTGSIYQQYYFAEETTYFMPPLALGNLMADGLDSAGYHIPWVYLPLLPSESGPLYDAFYMSDTNAMIALGYSLSSSGYFPVAVTNDNRLVLELTPYDGDMRLFAVVYPEDLPGLAPDQLPLNGFA